jgi:hypothetical protein
MAATAHQGPPTRKEVAMAAIAFNSPNQAAGDPATLGAPFLPLDPGAVSDAIPAFFIGRNREGFWVARESRGRIGGLFLFETGPGPLPGGTARRPDARQFTHPPRSSSTSRTWAIRWSRRFYR